MNIGGGARLNWRGALQARRSRQDDVQSGSRFETCRSNDIAALNLIQAKLGQIDCGAHAGLRKIDIPPVALNRANASRNVSRLNRDRLSALNLAACQSAGNDCTDAVKRERAIDEQSGLADIGGRL